MSKPHVDAARRWVSTCFNTCSETSELCASRRYSCLFCTQITSFSHIRNVETPCGRRPEVGFNTCSEMSRQAACRRYSCPHIASFSHIGNVETPCGRRPEAGFNTCSETSELSACRRYSCLLCTHITSFSHIRNVEPHVDAARRWVSTCSETSEMSASRRFSCLFCAHITSFSHIRNVDTPCGRRPEAGFNTCSETSELSACRRYSCLILQSHHLVSSHQLDTRSMRLNTSGCDLTHGPSIDLSTAYVSLCRQRAAQPLPPFQAAAPLEEAPGRWK